VRRTLPGRIPFRRKSHRGKGKKLKKKGFTTRVKRKEQKCIVCSEKGHFWRRGEEESGFVEKNILLQGFSAKKKRGGGKGLVMRKIFETKEGKQTGRRPFLWDFSLREGSNLKKTSLIMIDTEKKEGKIFRRTENRTKKFCLCKKPTRGKGVFERVLPA